GEGDERPKLGRARMASTICGSGGALLIVGVGVGAGMNVVEDLLDAVLAGDRTVVEESKLGNTLEAQPRADLPPQERSGALERTLGGAPRLLVAERSVIHARLLDVSAHLDARQRHEPDARIVHVAGEELGELAANLIGH